MGLKIPIVNDLLGDDPGDPAGEAAAAEERRKAELRRRIDLLYGISNDATLLPAEKFTSTSTNVFGKPRGGLISSLGPKMASANVGISAKNEANRAEAGTALTALDAEKTKLADATRGYYADQLADAYDKGERQSRFSLARRGLLGGSADVDAQSELAEDRDLGATRVDEAVQRAVAALESSREQERLGAISLVNSGSGESAVTAAQRGLQNAFNVQASAQKADLTGDLFSAGANAFALDNANAQAAALEARYRDRLATFFTPRSTTSGRVTPSGG